MDRAGVTVYALDEALAGGPVLDDIHDALRRQELERAIQALRSEHGDADADVDADANVELDLDMDLDNEQWAEPGGIDS